MVVQFSGQSSISVTSAVGLYDEGCNLLWLNVLCVFNFASICFEHRLDSLPSGDISRKASQCHLSCKIGISSYWSLCTDHHIECSLSQRHVLLINNKLLKQIWFSAASRRIVSDLQQQCFKWQSKALRYQISCKWQRTDCRISDFDSAATSADDECLPTWVNLLCRHQWEVQR